jgi:ketohexokinase
MVRDRCGKGQIPCVSDTESHRASGCSALIPVQYEATTTLMPTTPVSETHALNDCADAAQRSDGSAGSGRSVLGVGIATLDIINSVERYPDEDAEVRASSQRIVRGGNCANTLSVLSALGHRCSWAGTMADDAGASLIREDLRTRGISVDHSRSIAGGATPTSYITLSRATGSRTIVHHRNLPELVAADIADVDFGAFDWCHFEGRNPDETAAMIARIGEAQRGAGVSVEIEKPRPGIERLFSLPDDRMSVVLVSRAFAAQQGAEEPKPFLRAFARRCRARFVILAWGAEGAYGIGTNDEIHFAPAFAPSRVVDTIAAGDVFNAAVIHNLLEERPLDQALSYATRLAGHSCGREGIGDIVESARTAGLIQ